MKISFRFTVLLLYIIFLNSSFAQIGKSLVVSPFIGEKLERVERNYFKLFTYFDGFEEGIFYLNPDSSLKVNIRFQEGNELKDTIIEKYRPLRSLRFHIDQVMLHPAQPTGQAKDGSYATILLTDSTVISGELIETGKYHLQVYNPEYKIPGKYDLGSSGYRIANFNDIKEVKCESVSTNIAPLIYSTAGYITGTIIVISKNDGGGDYFGFEKLLGGLVGALVGGLLGFIVPIHTDSETVFTSPFDKNDIKGLKNRTRIL